MIKTVSWTTLKQYILFNRTKISKKYTTIMNPDMMVREIASLVGIPSSTLTSALNRLENKNYVNFMEKVDIGSAEISYCVYGKGDTTIVIDAALSSCSAEWWHIANILSTKYKVIVYDRAGYGNSTNSKLYRTPVNIVSELNKLISKIDTWNSVILVGHSQGGYYAAQFALQFPEKVKGLVLLDPATPFDYEFKENLTEAIDKCATINM